MIGCEDRLRNDLYCVEWGVKLYSNQPFNVHCIFFISQLFFLYCLPQSNYSTSVVLFTCLRFYLNVHMIHCFFSLLKTRLFHKLFLSAQVCFCQDFLQSLASCTVIFSYFSIVISYLMLCQVSYDVDGFCERNRDVLFTDLIQLMQSSTQ